jgi:hypothetical protein
MLLVPDVNQTVQKGAGGDHERSAGDRVAFLEFQPGDLVPVRADPPRRV